MKAFTLSGIPIAVEKKRIKNMYLRVLPPDGHVTLSAPLHAPDAVIKRFAESKLAWLTAHRARFAAHAALSYETGETHTLWGVPYTLVCQEIAGRRRVSHALENPRQIVLRLPEHADAETRQHALSLLYRAELEAAIPSALARCEAIVGKQASVCRIRYMKTRFGTCNIKTAALTINLQLAVWEPKFLDYILIHELTHLWEPSHNRRFQTLMDGFCPDWRTLRKQLKALAV